jgi:hypothetical protein
MVHDPHIPTTCLDPKLWGVIKLAHSCCLNSLDSNSRSAAIPTCLVLLTAWPIPSLPKPYFYYGRRTYHVPFCQYSSRLPVSIRAHTNCGNVYRLFADAVDTDVCSPQCLYLNLFLSTYSVIHFLFIETVAVTFALCCCPSSCGSIKLTNGNEIYSSILEHWYINILVHFPHNW